MTDAVIIGAGPAGLMAAQVMAGAGVSVTVVDAKPSVGRKFLMAGKSGLNLTRNEEFDSFMAKYDQAADWLRPMLADFSNEDVKIWAEGLGQELFTGSTGRVFPKKMKASPLLRALLADLTAKNVQFLTRWYWMGWQDGALRFSTPNGEQSLEPKAVILALGGASWARLGSDGAWADILKDKNVALTPFQPANFGLSVGWSKYMAKHFGKPVKSVALKVGEHMSRGEFVISERGLEGGGIYMVSKAIREGGALTLDLLPDLSQAEVARRLSKPSGKTSLANRLRKALRLDPARIALLQEFARPLPTDAADLSACIKALPVQHDGPRPLDEAISTAGGIAHQAVDDDLMLRDLPGVFCAGEMLDWEAPTGGYLLTACLSTGRWAGLGAMKYLAR